MIKVRRIVEKFGLLGIAVFILTILVPYVIFTPIGAAQYLESLVYHSPRKDRE